MKDDLIEAHHQIQESGESHENPVLADLRQQLTDAVDTEANGGDKGLAHQVLVFANQLQDVSNRAKRRVDSANNVINEPLQIAKKALEEAKAHVTLAPDGPDKEALLTTLDKAIEGAS